MNAVLGVAAFLGLSAATTIGYVLGALLASSKIRELQMAYLLLSRAIHAFLGDSPDGLCGMMVLGDEDLLAMRQTLATTDEMAGVWTIEDYRR